MDPKLNDLLHWAVENTNQNAQNQTQTSTAIAPLPASSNPAPLSITYHPQQSNHSGSESKQNQKLDTGVLDAILGRTDAVRMREAMSIFEDPDRSIQERSVAGEELEELIQDLDNANDMEVLGFWPKLIRILENSNNKEEEEEMLKFYACWICGTAVQNNTKSQTAFLKRDPLPTILEILCHATEPTQAKAMYCLSSTLKHAPESANVMATFRDAHGWEALLNCLRGPSMNLRRKAVFLINTLLLEHSLILDELRSTGILTTLITSLSPSKGIPTGQNGDLSAQDEDYSEKALRTIVTVLINSSEASSKQKLEDGEKGLIKEILFELKGDGSLSNLKPLVESAGISESEWSQALEALGMST